MKQNNPEKTFQFKARVASNIKAVQIASNVKIVDILKGKVKDIITPNLGSINYLHELIAVSPTAKNSYELYEKAANKKIVRIQSKRSKRPEFEKPVKQMLKLALADFLGNSINADSDGIYSLENNTSDGILAFREGMKDVVSLLELANSLYEDNSKKFWDVYNTLDISTKDIIPRSALEFMDPEEVELQNTIVLKLSPKLLSIVNSTIQSFRKEKFLTPETFYIQQISKSGISWISGGARYFRFSIDGMRQLNAKSSFILRNGSPKLASDFLLRLKDVLPNSLKAELVIIPYEKKKTVFLQIYKK